MQSIGVVLVQRQADPIDQAGNSAIMAARSASSKTWVRKAPWTEADLLARDKAYAMYRPSSNVGSRSSYRPT